MAIELHHLNTHGMMEQACEVLDGVVRLKARIAEMDKVIAEKDKEIKVLKDKLRHYPMMVALLEKDEKEIEELNAVHQKSLARLEELVNKEHPDKEEDHIEADGILCNMLDALGYKDLTEVFDKIDKWYC